MEKKKFLDDATKNQMKEFGLQALRFGLELFSETKKSEKQRGKQLDQSTENFIRMADAMSAKLDRSGSGQQGYNGNGMNYNPSHPPNYPPNYPSNYPPNYPSNYPPPPYRPDYN